MDVLVTHAPAAGLGDGDDRFHEGFETFVKLIDKYQPRYHLHGHQHMTYSIGSKRIIPYHNTVIVTPIITIYWIWTFRRKQYESEQ